MKMKIEPLGFNTPTAGITAFTTLRGLVDTANPYSEINLCDYTGDDPAHVSECHESLCRHLGITPDKLVMPRQTHTASVVTITHNFFSLTPQEQQALLNEKDAIVTTLSGVAIGINTADCVPIVLADPRLGIIAAAHAGWKGTAMRIAAATVAAMQALGSQPCDIFATIGASICQDCFEVGDEVVERFAEAGFSIDAITRRHAITGKAHISLQEANRMVLTDCGILPHNIATSGECTRCEPEKYFSARRIGIKSGRTFTGILKK